VASGGILADEDSQTLVGWKKTDSMPGSAVKLGKLPSAAVIISKSSDPGAGYSVIYVVGCKNVRVERVSSSMRF